MYEILITNDDGIDSPGLEALAVALSALVMLTVVAPDRERSAASHGITLIEPVMYHQIAERRFAVQGTPADCVITALTRIMPRPPSLVVSGVNRGLNVGHDIYLFRNCCRRDRSGLAGHSRDRRFSPFRLQVGC